jgi:hypothetical protein
VSSNGTSSPPQATFPIPPPAWRLPFIEMRGGQGYLTTNGQNFLQLLWAAVQGQGGLLDIDLLTLFSAGQTLGIAGPQARDIADQTSLRDRPPMGAFAALAQQLAAAAAERGRPTPRGGLSASQINWTPTLAGAGTPGAQTYATQHGQLAHVGPLVIATFSLVLSAYDGATAGALEILGLPAASSTSDGAQAGWVSNFGGVTLGASATQIGVQLAAGASAISLVQSGSGIAAAPVDAAGPISNTAQIVGGIAFFR